MATKNYYTVYIEVFPPKYQIFFRLCESKKYIIENYSFCQCFILARRRKDNLPVYVTFYSPKSGFSKIIKY